MSEGSERDDVRFAYTSGLRQLADYIDDNPSFPLPNYGNYFCLYVNSRDELVKILKETYGSWDKQYEGGALNLKRRYGPHTLTLTVSRGEVCQRVVTGTRWVPERTIPGHTEEIVEWVCEEPILREVE